MVNILARRHMKTLQPCSEESQSGKRSLLGLVFPKGIRIRCYKETKAHEIVSSPSLNIYSLPCCILDSHPISTYGSSYLDLKTQFNVLRAISRSTSTRAAVASTTETSLRTVLNSSAKKMVPGDVGVL